MIIILTVPHLGLSLKMELSENFQILSVFNKIKIWRLQGIMMKQNLRPKILFMTMAMVSLPFSSYKLLSLRFLHLYRFS